jgi:hypothetical protein
LVLVAGTGVASARTSPGHTIATAGTLTMGPLATGGGGAIDFWKVKLHGGDVVRLAVTYPAGNAYTFALYAPGTNDANFQNVGSFSSAATNTSGGVSKSVLDLQAAYNGTFILAACENVLHGDCHYAGSTGNVPMGAYTFTPTLVNGGVPAAVAAKETKAGATIAKAGKMGAGNFEAGGANTIDFWKMNLRGGDRVRFAVTYPVGNAYTFALYAPGTSDANFRAVGSFSSAATNASGGVSKSVLDLQAPYNGTFVLAVCEDVLADNCFYAGSTGPVTMGAYTFTPTLVDGGVRAAVAARETKAGATIAAARKMGAGNFEAGGANTIDFWKMTLRHGDKMRFAVNYTAGNAYTFALYAPGTNDSTFRNVTALSSQSTNPGNGVTRSILALQAPSNGTFILAVCEDVVGANCAFAGSTGPVRMGPYTFTTKQTGGRETRTSLKLSASTVRYGHEKSLKFSVAVSAVYAGHATGKVTISDGRTNVCTVKLVKGKGSCSPATNRAIPAGRHSIVASYGGNLLGSKSGTVTLRVRR